MVRRATILLLAAASFGSAAAAPAGEPPEWALGELPNACMLQSVSPHGTMLSIWGFAQQARFGVLLQNRGWDALRDGELYTLSLEFVGQRAWPVQATAREHIDSDGPGFFFTLAPGDAGDDGLIDALSSARGMHISRDGRRVDTLPLGGSREAMSALARCLAERWDAAAPADKAAPVAAQGAAPI
jgi:hypothetical protein